MRALDYAVLVAYLVGTVTIGLIFAKRNRTVRDMFTAGGASPWWVSGLSSFMTMFSAGTFVVWGGIAYKYGLVAIVINMMYGIAAFGAGYWIAARWNATGVRTPAEFIERRFGRAATQFYTWTLLLFRVVDVGITLYALAVVVAAVMPLPVGHAFRDATTGNVAIPFLIVGFGIVIICYTMVGGLWAVLMTDVLQFVILNLSVVFVLILTLARIQHFNHTIAAAPPGFFLPTAGSYGYLFLVAWCATQFFIIGGDWAFAQRFLSVHSPRDAKKATYLFSAMYFISPIIWLTPPLLFRLSNPGVNPEQAYILAGKAVLPGGMVGLLVAAMFSATASMVSGYLNVFAGVLTNDVYRRSFRADAGERELVFAGRVFASLIGFTLVGLAIVVPQIAGAEKIVILWATLIVGPLMAPTIWGLLSRKVGAGAVWATVATAFLVGITFKIAGLSGQLVDVTIGVVIPIVVLSFAHWMAAGEDQGWRRVIDLAKGAGNLSTRVIDSTPAFTIAIAVIVTGMCILALIPFDAGSRVHLGIFGVGVVTLGGLLWFAAKQSRSRIA